MKAKKGLNCGVVLAGCVAMVGGSEVPVWACGTHYYEAGRNGGTGLAGTTGSVVSGGGLGGGGLGSSVLSGSSGVGIAFGPAMGSVLPPAGAAPGTMDAVAAWKINYTNARAHSPNATINSFIQNTPSDVQSVWYDANYVYVRASGVPSHDVGRADGNNPAYARNLNQTWRLPRNPLVATSPTSLGGGPVGVMANGAPMFDPGDAQSYNNLGTWRRVAAVFEAATFDVGPGHSAPGMGQQPSNSTPGQYHYHIGPTALVDQIDSGNTGLRHSPIIGFSFDGFPIYGPYGYANPTDPNGGVKLLATSYKVRDDLSTVGAVRRSTTEGGTQLASNLWGPNVGAAFPGGSFKEDYKYVAGLGDLNNFNMRFEVTPEYPLGTWAYHMTMDATGKAAFPYLTGPQYFGTIAANPGASVVIPAGAVQLVAGDTNFDGAVNFTDLLTFARNYRKQGLVLWSQGDFDANVFINDVDLNLLAGNYTPAGSFAADWVLAQSMIPEPSAGAVVMAAVVGVGMRRGRRAIHAA